MTNNENTEALTTVSLTTEENLTLALLVVPAMVKALSTADLDTVRVLSGIAKKFEAATQDAIAADFARSLDNTDQG